jgi:hypothetical protein
MYVPWDRKKHWLYVFAYLIHKKHIFNFSSAKQVFYVKQFQEAQSTVSETCAKK